MQITLNIKNKSGKALFYLTFLSLRRKVKKVVKMKAPYNALDVANYIVSQAVDRQNPVTPLKLQKLLYYVVAKYLQEQNELLIKEPIHKWQYGPVVESVYHAFKPHGSALINKPYAYLSEESQFEPNQDGKIEHFILHFTDTKAKYNELDNNPKFKEIVNLVLDALLDKAPFALVEKTYQEHAWSDFKDQIMSRQAVPDYTEQELKNAEL